MCYCTISALQGIVKSHRAWYQQCQTEAEKRATPSDGFLALSALGEASAVCSRFAVKACRTIWPMARCPDQPAQAALSQPLASRGCLQACLLRCQLPAGLLAPLSAACSLWKLNVWRKVLPVRYESRQTNATDARVC